MHVFEQISHRATRSTDASDRTTVRRPSKYPVADERWERHKLRHCNLRRSSANVATNYCYWIAGIRRSGENQANAVLMRRKRERLKWRKTAPLLKQMPFIDIVGHIANAETLSVRFSYVFQEGCPCLRGANSRWHR